MPQAPRSKVAYAVPSTLEGQGTDRDTPEGTRAASLITASSSSVCETISKRQGEEQQRKTPQNQPLASTHR